MGSRGGRDRYHRGNPPARFEEKSRSGRGNVLPSRHLWVGNLSHNIRERDLTHHLLRFGEIENVAFQPGRSYAFINFVHEDDAVAAMETLQGFSLDGNPLRIEFTKADKSSGSLPDERYPQHQDVKHSDLRGSPISRRDSRTRHVSPDPLYLEKSKTNDKNGEPSEVLWIGFPASFKVDEALLRKAFSPFGDIEKITAFPGRSYAFVRFWSLRSACRAKESLQGKLFGNPRVHICFAKGEAGSSNNRRNSMDPPGSPSPHFKSNGHPGFSENFRKASPLRDPSMRSPRLISNFNSGDSNIYNRNTKDTSWTGGNNRFEKRWTEEIGPEAGLPQERFEHHSSPPRQHGGNFHEFTRNFPKRGPFYEDTWDMPDDSSNFHSAKKMKTGTFPPDNELPEYPFSDLKEPKPAFSRLFSDVPQPEVFDKNFEAGVFQNKPIPDRLMNSSIPLGERSDQWTAPFDNFHQTSERLLSNPREKKIFTPEPNQSNPNEWKWEGTIAKGGTPVCLARCFPVGKVLDIILPEVLDCTARTGLDVLAKHYYQAVDAFVVFFVPQSDNDMGFYNEFMHYLEEKQRAAVAMLDGRTTMFLVPPSEFSENVLKVPGKLSISGVVLRLEHPGSHSGSHHYPDEKRETHFLSSTGDTLFPKSSTPSGPFPQRTPFPDVPQSGANTEAFLGHAATFAPPSSFPSSLHGLGVISDSYNGNRYEPPLQQKPSAGQLWYPHNVENPISGPRNVTTEVPNSSIEPISQGNHSVMSIGVQQTSYSQAHHTGVIYGIPESGNSKSFSQESNPTLPLSMPTRGLQQEQLAQLTSSLIGQQSQVGNTPNVSTNEGLSQTNMINQPYNPFYTSQHTSQNNQATPDLSVSQYSQVQQLKQQQHHISNVPQMPHTDIQAAAAQGNQQMQIPRTQDTGEEDPQKRLQATLQLAAALLQQIQQGKGT